MSARPAESGAVLLCIPPSYCRDYPPLGTPALTAFLRSKGIGCLQSDLNLGFAGYCAGRRRARFPHPRGKVNYEFESLPGSSFKAAERILSDRQAMARISDSRRNVFHGYFSQSLYPLIRRYRPRILGLSVTAPSQAVCSFTFGMRVKKEFPGVHVVMGGQWCSLFREALLLRDDLARCYDSVIIDEGESALLALSRQVLSGSADLGAVPNCIYKRRGRPVFSEQRVVEDMDALPAPCFDGLPLARYAKPGELLYESSRGCYWGKCAFCVDLPVPQTLFREKSAALVIRDLKILRKRYRPARLIFSNATMSPRQLASLSRQMIRERIRLRWWAWGRFDPRLDAGIFRLAKRAGCQAFSFGLESACQKVLNSVSKGTDRPTIERIITQADQAGLSVTVQVILGLPGESLPQALDTIAFLVSQGERIEQAVFNAYYLTPKNRIFDHPQRYGIAFKPEPAGQFRFLYDFRCLTGGLAPKTVVTLINLYRRLRAGRRLAGRLR